MGALYLFRVRAALRLIARTDYCTPLTPYSRGCSVLLISKAPELHKRREIAMLEQTLITSNRYEDIKPGAWVKAPNFLFDAEADNPEDTRSMRVLRTFEHNGRLAFDAMVAAREGDAPATLAERTVWRYASQVTRIVRPARRAA